MPAPRPEGFTSDRAFAFLTFAFLIAVIYVDWRFVRSKVGRAVLSLKHSEAVASSYGINVTAYKVLAFILSGLLAGIGGGLFWTASTVFFIINAIRIWKGGTLHIAPVEDAAEWLNEKIQPQRLKPKKK